jgi:nucleoid-associated protein YgaU
MRQFVLGILVAAFVWWGYSAYGGEPAEAGSGAGGAPVAPGAGNASLDQLVPKAAPNGPAAPAGGSQSALDAAPQAAVTRVAPDQMQDLLAGIGQGDAAAVARGWAIVAGRAGDAESRRSALAALTVPKDGFPALLAQLGGFNTFLHSAEGRAQAGRALAAAMALADADAVTAGTQLLDLCLRGPIEKQDVAAREFVDAAYQQHRIRVDRWLCDPANVQGARSHTVASGESLARIAGRFRKEKILVDDGTLAILNRIHNPNALQVGQKVKIPIEPIRSVLEKRSFSLCVYVGDRLLRLYWVGHGENDKTPVTEFTVTEKQPRPEWTSPDGNVWPYGHPNNILGEYFIKLQHASYTGFGVHGTPMPETIGTMSSMGCIRMLAPDITEYFKLVPRGTKLVVRASAPTP